MVVNSSICCSKKAMLSGLFFFFFQAEDGIRDLTVTGVQTCALPISARTDGGRRVNADSAELAKFEASASAFWDPHGEFRPLHLLNPVRTQFIAERTEIGRASCRERG